MTAQAVLWTGAGAAFLVAVLAGVADYARSRRRDLDSAGWVPWTGIQIVAIFATLVFAVLAFRT